MTLGTSLDGYTYTKRVGWVPYEVFADYEGPDRRNTRAMSDVCGIKPSVEGDTCEDKPRMSRSISDVTGATQSLSELSKLLISYCSLFSLKWYMT